RHHGLNPPEPVGCGNSNYLQRTRRHWHRSAAPETAAEHRVQRSSRWLPRTPRGLEQQYVSAKWLRQELDSSGLHGLDGHRHVTITRDENDGHVRAIEDALLQIQ